MKAKKRGKTLTRVELREAVYDACIGLSRAQVRTLCDEVLDEIAGTLTEGESVHFRSFGVFDVKTKRARPGRNPRTLADCEISARRIVKFRPSPLLVARVNGVPSPVAQPDATQTLREPRLRYDADIDRAEETMEIAYFCTPA